MSRLPTSVASVPASPKMKKRPVGLSVPAATEVDVSPADLLKAQAITQANKAITDQRFLAAIKPIVSSLKEGDRVSNLVLARKINMARMFWERHQGKVVFEAKEDGITSGFIVIVPEGKLYVKNFLGESTAGKSDVVELFTYILLEKLGFGPRVEAFNCSGASPFIASYDLAKKGDDLIFGEGAKGYLAKERRDDERCKSRVIALEVATKILNLGDTSHNPGNFGIVVTKEGEVLPQLVDFNFNPIIGTGISRRGSNIRLIGLQRDLATKAKAADSASVGLTMAFAGVEISEGTYDAALELISEDKLESAIAASLVYCVEFVEGIIDPEVKRKGFDIADLGQYIDEVRENFAKLKMARRSSTASETVGSLLREGSKTSIGSGPYVEFGDFDPAVVEEESQALRVPSAASPTVATRDSSSLLQVSQPVKGNALS